MGMPLPCFPMVDCEARTEIDIEQHNGYAYANLTLPENVTWTVGFSYDSFDNEVFERDEINPKGGV